MLATLKQQAASLLAAQRSSSKDLSKRRVWKPLHAASTKNVGSDGIDKPYRMAATTGLQMDAVLPTAGLLGGTVAVYSSLISQPSCTLTPLAIIYMLLLAIQTSLQPRISRRFISPKVSKVKVAFVEEIIKASVAAGIFVGLSSEETISAAMKDWSIQSSLIVGGLPATLYALQGVLTYQSHQNLDAVTFNGLSQTKTLAAALCCYLVMGKRQSGWQMVALGLLFISALLFQKSNAPSSQTGDASGLYSSKYFLSGVVPCLGATFLSGLAGAFSQRGLQIVGGTGRNALLFTCEVSFISALVLLVSQGVKLVTQRNVAKENVAAAAAGEWSWTTLVPITTKAFGGIFTAMVHKHAGSVVKGFGLMLALVLSGLLQFLWVTDEESLRKPKQLPVLQILGIFIVMLSSWIHFTNPPV